MNDPSELPMSAAELRGFLRLAAETMPDRFVSLRIATGDERVVLQAVSTPAGLFLTDGGMTLQLLADTDRIADVERVEAVCSEHGVQLAELGWIVGRVGEGADLHGAVLSVERAIEGVIASADARTAEVSDGW